MKLALINLIVFMVLAQSAATIAVQSNSRETKETTPASGEQNSDPFFRKAKLKAEIELAERANSKMKSEAAQLNDIAGLLRDGVATNQPLTEVTERRLSNIEKLAKGIRDKAAGSDDDEDLPEPPKTFAEGVATLNELAEKLIEAVDKTSRFTTSAAVIENSNRIITLTRYLRKQYFN